MKNKEWIEIVTKDVDARNLQFAAVVLFDEENSKLQYISYDENGCVSFITEKVNQMSVFEKNNDGTISNLVDIHLKG